MTAAPDSVTGHPVIGSFGDAGHKLLATADIAVPERLRLTDEDHVAALAASIADKGQMQATLVALNPRRNGQPYVLIAGAHRLAACAALGIEVTCSILRWRGKSLVDFDIACRLREIDDNLMRYELSALDRAVFLYERKKIYEELYPETKQGGDRKSADFKEKNQNDIMPLCFSEDTAEKLGFSKRTIEKYCQIAKNIPAGLRRQIAGTWLARKQGELLYLSKQDPDTQEQIVDTLLKDGSRHKPGAVKSVGAALKLVGGGSLGPDLDTLLRHLKSAYVHAPAATQKAFLYYLRDTGQMKRIGPPSEEGVAEAGVAEAGVAEAGVAEAGVAEAGVA